jgi:hypothetical protein
VNLLPATDAPVVKRQREAGAILLGKTNVPVLSHSGTNANDSWAGRTRNVVMPERAPGGSSAGTASAVASAMSVLGFGEETGGSIQNPASAQDLVGIKPTEEAGVSVMIVSNVLRDRGRVGEETRQRVLEAVERKGYRPNLTARALVERKAPTLALMLSCITNPVYPEFTLAANLSALKHERHLLVCNTDHEPDRGTSFLQQVAVSLSDGVLVANYGDLPVEELRELQQRGVPVVISVWGQAEERQAFRV